MRSSSSLRNCSERSLPDLFHFRVGNFLTSSAISVSPVSGSRLRAHTLVDVQPQNQLSEGSIALAKYRNIKRNVKPGRTDEQIVLYLFFAGCSLKSPTTEILSMASEHLKALG